MTHPDDWQPYEHAVPTWTVGELRQALASLPDALPVRVAMPQTPPVML
ncbi:DUF6225 family protein [Streptomyces niveus]